MATGCCQCRRSASRSTRSSRPSTKRDTPGSADSGHEACKRRGEARLAPNPVHIKGAGVERSIERPTLDWDDIERIADAIHPRFRALVWVGATSGLRYGELTGLMRRHVDIEDRSLRVDQALSFVKGQGATLGPPKSAAAHRTMVIPIGVAEMLAGHIEEHLADDPDALVFTSVKDSPLVNRYFAPYWKKALKEAGLDESIRFHDLRHHAGTSAATAGASLREIMARMGHAAPRHRNR